MATVFYIPSSTSSSSSQDIAALKSGLALTGTEIATLTATLGTPTSSNTAGQIVERDSGGKAALTELDTATIQSTSADLYLRVPTAGNKVIMDGSNFGSHNPLTFDPDQNILNFPATNISLPAQILSNTGLNLYSFGDGVNCSLVPTSGSNIVNKTYADALGTSNASATTIARRDGSAGCKFATVNASALESLVSSIDIGAQNSTSTINIATGTASQTVNVGTGSGTTTINLGAAGDTVNIAGTLAYVNTTNLNVTDSLITLNKGGATASGGGSGFEIEENSVKTGYVKQNAGRTAWLLRGSANASDFTIDQDISSTSNPGFATVTAGRFKTSGNVALDIGTATGNVFMVGGNQTATGTNNFLAGASCGYQVTSGLNNTGIGVNALQALTTASNNIAIGTNALQASTASSNVSVGNSSLNASTTGSGLTAVGTGAGILNTTGSFNSIFGSGALATCTTGGNCTAVGYNALHSTTLVNNVTALGYIAGYNSTGQQNTFLGSATDASPATVQNATALGYGATVATSNTCQIGNSSLTSINTSAAITCGGIVGVTTNSLASAGQVGQLVTASTNGTPISIPNNGYYNITSVSLTAGDWDVDGYVSFDTGQAGATTVVAWINSVGASIPSVENYTQFAQYPSGNSAPRYVGMVCPPRNFQLSSTTLIYLSYQLDTSQSYTTPNQAQVWGQIRARRRR